MCCMHPTLIPWVGSFVEQATLNQLGSNFIKGTTEHTYYCGLNQQHRGTDPRKKIYWFVWIFENKFSQTRVKDHLRMNSRLLLKTTL
jgi:hypothetical protein